MPNPTDIDLNQLRLKIRKMNYKDAIYRVLKEELSLLGHWKNRPRGKPTGFQAEKVSNLAR